MSESTKELESLLARGYQHGFVTDIESDTVPPGLDEDVVRLISRKKGEPEFLTQWRLKALRHWLTLKEPHWAHVRFAPIDYQDISYYSAPKAKKDGPKSLAEVDPKLLETYEKLGVPLHERARLAGVAVDAVFDSVSVATTFKERLKAAGVVFSPFSEAVRSHPELIEQYLGSVVPYTDNFFATLNSAVFTDGSFVYVPKGVRCPMELSTYFRINAAKTGQFERTLIIADEGAYVSYLEGCLPAWEEVSYGDEMRCVRDVALHDVVLNDRGEEAEVAKIMRRRYLGDMVEITPRSAANRFHVTPEHPVLAIRRARVKKADRGPGRWSDIDSRLLETAQPEYVPAGELAPGDLLVFPINKVERDDSSLSDDFLKLLGYYVAEGWATKFNGYDAAEWCIGSHDADIADEIAGLVERCTGKRPCRFRDEKRHGLYLVVYSSELCAALVEHGGKYAHGKRFSKAVMDLPPQRQRLAIDTYYRGDGSIGRYGPVTMIRCGTVSRTLAFQLQEMLARRGVFAYMGVREAFEERMKDGKLIRHSQLYTLYYSEKTRGRRAIRRHDYFLVPVRKLRREPYDGFVYNFETSTDPHSYLVKGFAVHNCTAPQRDENQLHAAVVELVALDDAYIKYSTVQNWYPGDAHGVGGIYNFVTKRGECRGRNAHISWTQVETGSAITWKYPSCVLRGEGSIGEFYSVATVNNHQQADTGTKMIHIGRNTRSTIVSKGISAGHGQNTYRGLVRMLPSAHGARNFTQCDSLLMGGRCGAHTFPYVEVKNPTATVEHEASTSKISDEQLFYCLSRGIAAEDAVNMIVSGFCKSVFKELPMEFAVEAQNLLAVSLEGAVG
ncbi:MAG TPA: SufD family Fe-S cluster assembly protein [Steroidobacteraceae bacterium]|jgi:Fe-S cluster assembly protein SufB|nr:SufD family Fe-S cluster assembly protein [Steroidobacteraceae bacterium]